MTHSQTRSNQPGQFIGPILPSMAVVLSGFVVIGVTVPMLGAVVGAKDIGQAFLWSGVIVLLAVPVAMIAARRMSGATA